MLAFTVAASTGTASAHAVYVSSTPRANDWLAEPPTRVSVTLSEEVAPGSPEIRVTNGTGTRVDVNGTRIDPADARTILTDLGVLAPGVYTVSFDAVSAVDGHFSADTFYFGVQDANGNTSGVLPTAPKAAAAPPAAAEIAIRAAAFLTLALAAGAAALAALVWAPSTSQLPKETRSRGVDSLRFLLLFGALNALALAAVTTAWLAYALGSAAAAGSAISLSTPFNASLLARVVLAAAAGGVLLVARRRIRDTVRPREPLLFVGLGILVGAILVQSTASHAAASANWRPWGTLADAGHLVSVMLWVGGVAGLVLMRQRLVGEANAALAGPVLTRFSRLATFAVAGALAGGVALAVIEIGSVDLLVSTTYGALVLAKVSLFTPMAALGALNHFRSIPRLEDSAKAPAAVLSIARNVRFEVALGAVVLVLAAVLTALSPAATPPPAPSDYLLEDTVSGVLVQLQANPPPSVPQEYTLSVTFWNATLPSEPPLDGTSNATLVLALQGDAGPPTFLPLEGPHGNHYFAVTPALAKAGVWRIDGSVRLFDGSSLDFTFHLVLRGA